MQVQAQSVPAALWQSVRPRQWTKNLFVCAALLFAQKALDLPFALRTAAAFAIFCALSSAGYLLNDLIDAARDREHPVRRKRPLASGRLARRHAVVLMACLAAAGLAASWLLSPQFLAVALAYVGLQCAYTLGLKHIVIIDVFALAAGFVLRVVAGAVAIEVEISVWLIACTTLLSLFIGLSKRRHELLTMEESAAGGRPVLRHYSAHLLDQMSAVVTSATVIAYMLYTIAPETVERFKSRNLIYTVPFVLYGIFRYQYLVHRKESGGQPEDVLVSDIPLLIDVVLWAAAVGLIIYV